MFGMLTTIRAPSDDINQLLAQPFQVSLNPAGVVHVENCG
jgi:hypothetical protein